MSDQLRMFELPISEDFGTATSSPGSADGRLPFGSPSGPAIASAGPARARVNRFPRRGRSLAATIPAIFGLRGFSSSSSAALQRSLENRLRARLRTDGSIVFAWTWSARGTPSGRLLSRLRVSARTTFGSVCGLSPSSSTPLLRLAPWISPQAADAHGSGIHQHTASLCKQARGTVPSGFVAPTVRRGQLNPSHSRWLMGYPIAWDVCAATATRSYRSSPPK